MRIIMLLLFFLSLVSPNASANDVYNFYFQKAPGPKTVIQGGAAQSTDGKAAPEEGAPLSPDSKSLTSSSPKPNAEVLADGFARWGLELGIVEQVNWAKYEGYGLALKYNFNRYFGIKGGIAWTKLDDAYLESWQWARDERGDDGGLDGQVALSIEPLVINSFGHDLIKAGFQAGALTMRDWVYDKNRRLRPFVGGLVSLDFAKNFGVLADYKVALGTSKMKGETNDTWEAQLNAAMAIKF